MRLVGNIERGRGGATGGGSAAASVGVLLINTGSPAAPTEDAVRAYLETFLMDDRIRPLPAPVWRAILQHMVLPRRCPASAAKYASIWTDEGSPLIATSRALAALVENELRCGGVSGDEGGPGGGPSDGLPVRAAMTYGEPGIEEALEGLRATGCHRVVVLPLYPQSANSTTAAALDSVRRSLSLMSWDPRLSVVESYGDDAAYLDAITSSILSAGYDPAADYLLLSFHAVPLSDVDAGDTYPAQARRSARAIAGRLGAAEGAWSVAYQSPFEDGRRWTGPNTARMVRELARYEPRRLVVACPGFSIDCLETLYDIDQVMREEYRAVRADGGDGLVYVPCLNDTPAHAAVLSRVVRRVLRRAS